MTTPTPWRAMLLLATLISTPTGGAAQRIEPPVTRRGDQVDDYHGTRVADPYRWLEDVDSGETRAWVEAQNRVTFAFLAGIPERATIQRRLTTLWNYERYGAPFTRGGRYFYFKNDGLQSQSVLYQQAALDAPSRVLLDPNRLSADGTVALGSLELTNDGTLLAYGTSVSGSDWQELRVRDVATGRDRPDRLQWIKFSSLSWTADNAGFLYSRYPEPAGGDPRLDVNRNHTLYYHRLGTPQSEDVLIYERPDQPDWGLSGEVSEDGRYLVITVWLGTDRRNRLYYVDLADPALPKLGNPVVRLLDAFDAGYLFLGNDGPVFYVLTDQGAPNKRIVAIDVSRPEPAHWRAVVPEAADVIETVRIVHHTFVVEYLRDAHSALRLFAPDGRPLGDLALPTLGALGGVSGRQGDTEMFYAFTSFLYPTTIFRHDFISGRTTVFKAPVVAFDPSRFETRQVFYHSKDGTRVPMFLTSRKGITLDGTNPTYLYGYGGFNASLTPAFSTGVLVWLELGGIYAQPNLRGGGEYGEEWHQAGMLGRKQNVFDDFIAAAEWLIANRYTSRETLAIQGGSNGGLLVGAAMVDRKSVV